MEYTNYKEKAMKKTLMVTIALFIFNTPAFSGDLVYEPVNPSFGGNPLNGSWMYTSAQIQDPHGNLKEPATEREEDSTLDDFQETLQRQVLSRLSYKIVDEAFGDGELSEGTYNTGDYNIVVTSDLDNVMVTITDILTGESTELEVPRIQQEDNMTKKIIIISIMALIFCSGCVTEMKKAVVELPATSVYKTAVSAKLRFFPKPKQKIIAGVYSSSDLTGQYKQKEGATSFSTAVTQAGATILTKALNDSGWFETIERENLNNLLTERKIIKQTRSTFLKNNPGKQFKDTLPALLYAPIILESCIASYDTNVITGGIGLKYFGAGGSALSQVDQISYYLRAVSVRNGKHLLQVRTNKTILSRSMDLGFFRFVRFKRLLEAEAGVTTNEPTQMCVLEAIEKAVLDLIIEGILSGVWELENPDDIKHPTIQEYIKERDEGIKVDIDANGNLKYTKTV